MTDKAIDIADAALEMTPENQPLAYDGSLTIQKTCACGEEIREDQTQCDPCQLVFSAHKGIWGYE